MPCVREVLCLPKQVGDLLRRFALAEAYRIPLESSTPVTLVLAQNRGCGITGTAGSTALYHVRRKRARRAMADSRWQMVERSISHTPSAIRYSDVKLFQLFRLHRRRRAGHQVGGLL